MQTMFFFKFIKVVILPCLVWKATYFSKHVQWFLAAAGLEPLKFCWHYKTYLSFEVICLWGVYVSCSICVKLCTKEGLLFVFEQLSLGWINKLIAPKSWIRLICAFWVGLVGPPPARCGLRLPILVVFISGSCRWILSLTEQSNSVCQNVFCFNFLLFNCMQQLSLIFLFFM